MIRRPPRSTPFPYPPLFRSRLLRHTPLAVERQRTLAARHPLVPARLFPTQRVLRGPPRRVRALGRPAGPAQSLFRGLRSEEHTSELQSLAYLVCRLLLEKKN